MQVSIVIVNYNVKYFLEQCLASLRIAMLGIAGEIWVVDNNSQDGSMAYLQPLFPEVHFLPLSHNAGFASANNAALLPCKGKYVLFLNPDTIVAEDVLQKAISFMESHSDAGALGIKMIDGSGRFLPESKRGFPSPLASLFKQIGLAKCFPRSPLFAKYYLGHLSNETTNEVDILAGAFMLVRKEVLDRIGGFDEQFFMYGEDIDLSYRITKAGWKNYYFAESSIIHFKGESTAKGSLNYVSVFYQAMKLFVEKHFKGNGAFLYRLLLYAGIALRASVSVLSRLVGAFAYQNSSSATNNPLHFEIVGWPADKPLPAEVIIDNMPVKIISAAHSDQLLLAIGTELKPSSAIALLQQKEKGKQVWLHVVGTRSMVMSSDKNRAGIAAAW